MRETFFNGFKIGGLDNLEFWEGVLKNFYWGVEFFRTSKRGNLGAKFFHKNWVSQLIKGKGGG